MKPHVTASTRTVFRPTLGKRFYARASDAYYARAKQLVMAKYPSELDDLDFPGDLDETDFAQVLAYPYDHWNDRDTVQICLNREATPRFVWLRAAKRRALFFEYVDDGYGPHGYCRDEDKWRAFVRRVARFLRYVDDVNDFRSTIHPYRARSPISESCGVCGQSAYTKIHDTRDIK